MEAVAEGMRVVVRIRRGRIVRRVVIIIGVVFFFCRFTRLVEGVQAGEREGNNRKNFTCL